MFSKHVLAIDAASVAEEVEHFIGLLVHPVEEV
jgi:hypothetical protein